jgi:hypothetical protein
MPIQTGTATTISAAELARANALETQAAQQQTQLANQATTITGLQATVAARDITIAQLQAILAAVPPPVPVLGDLTIEGGKLRRAGMPAGESVVMRLAEVSYGSSDIAFGADKLCALVKSLGFNGLSPLFEGSTSGSLANMKLIGDAALRAGLIIGFNGDHMGGGALGRAWLTDPARVAYVNSLPNAFVRLEIEVDLVNGGDNPPDSAYVAGALGLVNAYRAAGGTRVIQVGAYQGGQRLEHVLRAGATVCAGDPLKKTLLGWQAYWGQAGTWYQGCAGLANGVAGTRAGIDAFSKMANAGCLGLLWRNAGGSLTGALQLIDDCIAKGQSLMWWEASKDAITDNNLMVDWDLLQLSANGAAVKAKLLPSQRLYF